MTCDAHANYHAWAWLLLSGLLAALVVASIVVDVISRMKVLP